MERRVLVLSYYFPPAGGPGVQRALKFVKYLPEYGWRPVVVTVQQGAYPAHDPSLADEVPAQASVHRTPSLDPHSLYARLTGRSEDEVDVGSVQGRDEGWMETIGRWVRANVFLPDARVGWVPFAVWRGRQLIAEKRVDAILTTGPPHSTHLSGALLQATTGVPWVADFRDPWTDINYYHELPHTRWARRLDAALERWVLRRARAVTTVSPSWRDRLARKAGRAASPITVVQNGFDATDIAPGQADPLTDTFDLTHVGSLYASRNPTALWRALRRLCDEDAVPALRIRLVGTVDPNVRRSLQKHGLMDRTEIVPYVPHEDAVEYMRRAGGLLLSIEEFPAADGMMTGKVYEYLAAGRPVVGVGPSSGDAAALLRATEGGRLFGRGDVSGLAQSIRAQYEAWADGTPRAGASPEALRPYRRRVQTQQIATVLRDVAEGRRSGPGEEAAQ
ncbi:MAG: glycosyltransferase [Salinibacter sp.]|uniref:glycosyltransferase n=1 Tax=Salinibacter sp. TaxID=2065818 RepID=UPI002FC2DF69